MKRKLKEPPKGLCDVLEELRALGDDGATVGEIVDHFAKRSLGAIFAMLGAIALVPPISAIPGVPGVTGSLIILAAAQSFLGGAGGIWTPRALRERRAPEHKLEAAVDKITPWARRIDRLLRPRLEPLADYRLVAPTAMALAVTFFPLGFVPFGVAAPAAGVMLLGLSLIGRDGLFASAGYALTGVTVWLIWTIAT